MGLRVLGNLISQLSFPKLPTHGGLSSSRKTRSDTADCSSLWTGPASPLSKCLGNLVLESPPAEQRILRTGDPEMSSTSNYNGISGD